MTKIYLKSQEKAQAILDYLEENPGSTVKQIASGLNLGLSTVYNTISDLGGSLEYKRIKTTQNHSADVFSVSKDDHLKLILCSVTEVPRAPTPHPLMQCLYGKKSKYFNDSK